MPKYCPECGETVKAGQNFCKKCGHKFFEKVAPAARAVPPPAPMVHTAKHSGMGIASLVLGIISMCLIWLNFWLLFYLFVELPMAIIATILGAIACWGKWKDKYGLAGFILGLLVIVIGMVLSIIVVYIAGSLR